MKKNTLERTCPICGKDNNCRHDSNCWCAKAIYSDEITKMIPKDRLGKACVCASCFEKYGGKIKL